MKPLGIAGYLKVAFCVGVSACSTCSSPAPPPTYWNLKGTWDFITFSASIYFTHPRGFIYNIEFRQHITAAADI